MVSDGHAFGRSRGSRGVNDVGDVIWSSARRGSRGLRLGSGGVKVDDRQIETVQSRPESGCGDRGRRRRIADDELEPRRGYRGVYRQICRPGLQYGEYADDRLSRAVRQQDNAVAGTHALRYKLTRQRIGGLVQLSVRQSVRTEGQRRSLGIGGHLRGEQFGNRYTRGKRPRENRTVANLSQARELVVDQGIQRGEPPIRIGRHLR